MNLLQRYLLREFLPVCLVALLFFVFMLELGDLFANLWRYLSNDVSIPSILRVMLLYLPKCVSFAMPLAVLFASAYTMAHLYARNELTSVFSAGYPLYFFIIPLLIFGFVLSIAMFWFEDRLVIRTQSAKAELVRVLLQQQESLSNTNLVILSDSGQTVYLADYYEDESGRLFTLTVIKRDGQGSFMSVIQCPSATWVEGAWVPEDPFVYSLTDDGTVRLSHDTTLFSLTENPATFRRNTDSVEEMTSPDAKIFVDSLRKKGLPYAEQLSNYYKRFSFPFTIFIVLFFSISLGGRFKKNILLMSVLMSLSVAVFFYITQMVSMIFAKWEYLSPLVGAWFPVILFLGLGAVILKYART